VAKPAQQLTPGQARELFPAAFADKPTSIGRSLRDALAGLEKIKLLLLAAINADAGMDKQEPSWQSQDNTEPIL
jgi:hypothetical protein